MAGLQPDSRLPDLPAATSHQGQLVHTSARLPPPCHLPLLYPLPSASEHLKQSRASPELSITDPEPLPLVEGIQTFCHIGLDFSLKNATRY